MIKKGDIVQFKSGSLYKVDELIEYAGVPHASLTSVENKHVHTTATLDRLQPATLPADAVKRAKKNQVEL